MKTLMELFPPTRPGSAWTNTPAPPVVLHHPIRPVPAITVILLHVIPLTVKVVVATLAILVADIEIDVVVLPIGVLAAADVVVSTAGAVVQILVGIADPVLV